MFLQKKIIFARKQKEVGGFRENENVSKIFAKGHQNSLTRKNT